MTSLVASEGDWQVRKTPCGKIYYINEKTGADQWAVPEELAQLGYTETGPPPCQTGGTCPGAEQKEEPATTSTTAGSKVKINMVDDL